MSYTCLIVEDEPLAAEVLQDYIRQVPTLSLVATCSDALFALEILQKEKVDLLFLDIHLPKLKGLDFLRSLPQPPKVILTTAYHEYALEGYELNVLDYLLKPIEFNRFLAAVNKMQGSLEKESPEARKVLPIQTEKRKVLIPIEDILYIESQKEYVKILTASKAYITKVGITKVEESLDPRQFLRIHRSFLIALNKVHAYDATEVEIEGKMIPIGRNYKDQVLATLARRA